MLSVIFVTYRPGGIDLLGASLASQQNAPPWELIVVDDHPGRPQRGIAEKHLRDLGLPLIYYGPSKPKTRPETKLGLANAMNTGVLHARGTHFLILHDYTIYPPDALATWCRKLTEYPHRKLISGWAEMHDGPKPTTTDDVLSFDPPATLTYREPWVPEVFEGFYFSAPISFFDEINGLDERTDHCTVWVLHVMIEQAKHFGWELRVDRELPCTMIDHRRWDGTDPHADPKDGLWRIKHHSSALTVPQWTPRSLNSFNFKALREMIR